MPAVECRTPMTVCRWFVTALFLLIAGRAIDAGEVRTQSGFVITGRPVELEGLTVKAARQSRGPTNIKHLYMVDDGLRRTFVPRRQVSKGDVNTENLLPFDEFELRRSRRGSRIGPSVVGSYLEKTPFDQDGRRSVTLAGARGPIHILQEITKLQPNIVTVNSTTHRWTYALTTNVLGDELLLTLLKKAVDDPDSSQNRFRIVGFLIDAGRYTPAQQELDALRKNFPEMQDRADQTEQRLNHFIAIKALGEIEQRRRAGQHQFASAYARKFPVDRVSADVRRDAAEIVNDFRLQEQKIKTARILLGQLQADLTEEQAQAVGPLRSILKDELNFATVDRLEPFLRSEPDDTLLPEEKLGLAYTGWLLGDAKAETSLTLALRLWRVRFLVLEYLRTSSEVDRQSALRELHDIDSATVETVAAMIPLLPMPAETGPTLPGVPVMIELAAEEDAAPLRYSVVLPPEYTPGRAYPMLVVLHSQGMSCERALLWWAGTPDQPAAAMNRGYIVVAPEYAEPSTEQYNYSMAAYRVVRETIQDVRQRYQVDSDRVFLTGHGMGGDAAFDIGMSHPDLFAGVLPIVGICDRYCKISWKNCPDLAWYVVGGEKDRNTLELNAAVLNKMMIRGYDITYTEYIERGYETYFEERSRMFEWMELHRRSPEPRELEIDLLRPTDAHLYWVHADQFRENALQPVVWTDGRVSARPQPLEAHIYPTGKISVRSGAQRTVVSLSPSLVNFDERIRVKTRGKQVFNDFVKPDLQVLLSDLRQRGDRQRLYWARIEF